MKTSEARAYLLSLERLGIKFGLENITGLAKEIGHPERSYRSILVAGTNGKGSTAALLESILRSAGYRTGRYTSPHLVRLEERMMVAGEPISGEELASVVETVRGASERLRSEGVLLTEPTFFEVTTACAFEFFQRKEVEIAVFEVGMGGRWDATNIVPAGMTIITPIGLDHERYLGDTLEAIAQEKAATIKPGCPVVVGFLAQEVLEVIRAEAERQGSPLIETESEVEVRVAAETVDGKQKVRLETPVAVYDALILPLLGEHQVENMVVAVRAAEIASSVGVTVTREAVQLGVAGTRWEARLEKISTQPTLLIDSAHNPLGASALARYLASQPSPRRVLLFALMDDKSIPGFLEPLLPHLQAMVATRPSIRRAKDPRALVNWAVDCGLTAESIESTERALARARELAGKKGEVVVAGSTFLAGEVKQILESEESSRQSAVSSQQSAVSSQ
jgi:dihydrofolate synthase/folylpolyglutamate synthase